MGPLFAQSGTLHVTKTNAHMSTIHVVVNIGLCAQKPHSCGSYIRCLVLRVCVCEQRRDTGRVFMSALGGGDPPPSPFSLPGASVSHRGCSGYRIHSFLGACMPKNTFFYTVLLQSNLLLGAIPVVGQTAWMTHALLGLWMFCIE